MRILHISPLFAAFSRASAVSIKHARIETAEPGLHGSERLSERLSETVF
jgi:hypothetical protein